MPFRLFDDWIDFLVRGKFDVEIPTLRIEGKTAGLYVGSGWISWSGTEGVQVKAITERPKANPQEPEVMVLPGQLIPHSSFVTVSGETQDGWKLTCTPDTLDGRHDYSTSPHLIWNFSVQSALLTQERDNDYVSIRAVFGPLLPNWTRTTDTSVVNECFENNRSERDWLMALPVFGKVGARKRSDEWFEVHIEPNEKWEEAEEFSMLDAISRAFSFISGKHCMLRGFESKHRKETKRFAGLDRTITINQINAPLGRDMAYMCNVETLLTKAIDFFMTEQGKESIQHLYPCWTIADGQFVVRLAVISIAVEGLLRIVAANREQRTAGYTPEEAETFWDWFDKNTSQFNPKLVSRVAGLRTLTSSSNNPKDILRDWKSRGILGVVQADLNAWDAVRNSTLHARHLPPNAPQPVLQETITDYHRLINLMNRMVL